MLAFIVVKAEPSANPSLGLGNVLIGIEVDFLVFQAAPQPLDKDVVHAAALAVHTDHNPVLLQGAGEAVTGELAALIGIENLVLDNRHASTARLTQSMMTTRYRKPLAIGM